MADTTSNPYVGPRPFEETESTLFFGRLDETRQLAALVIAQRVVVFHAPSGAGKTSLLKASLIPLLKERKKLIVLPISRVSGDLPSTVDPSAVANVYTYNTLVMLYGSETHPHDLPGLTLQDGLQRLMHAPAGETRLRPRLLIIDQFEELFTTHQAHHSERAGFFREMQQCLAAFPQLSLLITMRDDYIANLNFYAAQLPDRLRTRFRIERLAEKEALDAVQGPAAQAGTPFAPGVAEALVNNLRRVQPGQIDAESPRLTVALSAFIEPVHLQLVCRQLWEKLPPERTTILAEDVQQFGDVDQALTGFYEGAVQAVVTATSISPRQLRTWFNTQLITPARTRGLVYRGEAQTANLDNAAVDILNNAYIIRADNRGSDIWYELAHDRLVEPILAANAAWLAAYRNPLAEVSQAWLAGDRSETYLLTGEQLAEAQRFAAANPSDILSHEQEFLEESTRSQAEHQEKMRQTAERRRNLAVSALVVIIALSLLTVWAMRNASLARTQEEIARDQRATAEAAVAVIAVAQSTTEAEAENARRAEATAEANRLKAEEASDAADAQAKLASSRELATAAINNLSSDPELSILLALHAISVTYTAQAENALHQALQTSRVEQTLYGHIGPVNAVAVSPDETRLFTAGADGAVVVWDIASGERQFSFTAHRAPINRIAISPAVAQDGLRLATASDDGRIRLWALDNGPPGEPLLDLEGHNAKILGLAFSPNGARLATSGQDATIRLWNLSTTSFGQPITTLGQSPGPLLVTSALAFSPSGAALAAGRSDGSTVIWSVTSGRELLALTGHAARVYDVAFSPDGAHIATAAWDNARLWQSATGAELQRLAGHTAEVRSLAFHQGRDGPTLLATAGNDRRVKVWDVATAQELLTLSGHQGNILGVAFFPITPRLATAGEDGAVRVWTIGPSQEVLTFSTGGVEISDLSFTEEGDGLLVLDNDGMSHQWNLAAGKETAHHEIHTAGEVGSAGFSRNGARLAVGIRAEPPVIWDLAALPSARRTVSLAEETGKEYTMVALDSRGDFAATSHADRLINIWNTTTGARRHQLAGHRDVVLGFAFSPDGAYYASASADGTAILWDATTGKPRLILRGHTGEVRAVDFSPDGARVATGGADGLVKIWDNASGRALLSLAGHSARLSSVHFSPDGARVVTASGDKTAKVWDAATGAELLSFSGGAAAVVEAIFSPNGKQLATASVDGFVRLYTLDVQQLVNLAHTRLTRSLTVEECAKYLHVEQCPAVP